MFIPILLLFFGGSRCMSISEQLCLHNNSSLFCTSRLANEIKMKEQDDTLKVHSRARGIVTEENEGQRMDEMFLRLAREARDDPSCPNLKREYDTVCFSVPPIQAILETKAFCDAFVEMCSGLLKTNLFTKIKGFRIDFSRYCKKEKPRFDFVCPAPLRFHSYAEDAVAFCIRYQERCPDAEVPSEPIPFNKNKDHIYTREIKQFCDKMLNFAANYCTNPDILRVPKYQFPCAIYKYQCVDVYTRVIYGWG